MGKISITIDDRHRWVKINSVPLGSHNKNLYDVYQCEECHIVGRSLSPNTITVPDYYPEKEVTHCAGKFKAPKKVKVIKELGSLPAYKNLKAGSIHKVVSPPETFRNDRNGIWVQGVDIKVRLSPSEYQAAD